MYSSKENRILLGSKENRLLLGSKEKFVGNHLHFATLHCLRCAVVE